MNGPNFWTQDARNGPSVTDTLCVGPSRLSAIRCSFSLPPFSLALLNLPDVPVECRSYRAPSSPAWTRRVSDPRAEQNIWPWKVPEPPAHARYRTQLVISTPSTDSESCPTAKRTPPSLGPTAQRHEATAPESSRTFTALCVPLIIYTREFKPPENHTKNQTKQKKK